MNLYMNYCMHCNYNYSGDHDCSTDDYTPQQEQDDSVNYIQKVIEALYENGDPVSVESAELLERIIAKQKQDDSVGTLNITHHKGLENHDFDYFGCLPDGTYSLYIKSN